MVQSLTLAVLECSYCAPWSENDLQTTCLGGCEKLPQCRLLWNHSVVKAKGLPPLSEIYWAISSRGCTKDFTLDSTVCAASCSNNSTNNWNTLYAPHFYLPSSRRGWGTQIIGLSHIGYRLQNSLVTSSKLRAEKNSFHLCDSLRIKSLSQFIWAMRLLSRSCSNKVGLLDGKKRQKKLCLKEALVGISPAFTAGSCHLAQLLFYRSHGSL